MMLLVVLSSIIGMLTYLSPEKGRAQLQQRTQESLIRAKEALLAHAITRYEMETTPGGAPDPGIMAKLPCPDNGGPNPEGEQEPGCGNGYASALGMLPWKTLGVEPLRDGAGECLWYAVSGHYKTQPALVPQMVNEDSPGQLVLYAGDGNTLVYPNTPAGRPVAAIFAPGASLPDQNRGSNPGTQCGGDYTATNFLEDDIGLADNASFTNVNYGLDQIARDDIPNNPPINDQVVTITKADIWKAVKNRRYTDLVPPAGPPLSFNDVFRELTIELAQCLVSYAQTHPAAGDRRLPWAVPVNIVAQPNWYYSDPDNYADQVAVYGGRFPFKIDATANTAGYPPPQPNDNLFLEGQCPEFDNTVAGPSSFPIYRNLWDHWKDHVFYVVSEARAPSSAVPSAACGPGNRCLTVNGLGVYAAIVIFANSALPGQSRDGPQEVVDQKALTANYLEAPNAVTLDAEDGASNYQYIPGANFNDIMTCIEVGPPLAIDEDCDPNTPN